MKNGYIIEYSPSSQRGIYYVNDKYHRENGPAVNAVTKAGSYQCWYWCGMKHRHDWTQPAYIHSNGIKKYYWYGVETNEIQISDNIWRQQIMLEVL